MLRSSLRKMRLTALADWISACAVACGTSPMATCWMTAVAASSSANACCVSSSVSATPTTPTLLSVGPDEAVGTAAGRDFEVPAGNRRSRSIRYPCTFSSPAVCFSAAEHAETDRSSVVATATAATSTALPPPAVSAGVSPDTSSSPATRTGTAVVGTRASRTRNDLSPSDDRGPGRFGFGSHGDDGQSESPSEPRDATLALRARGMRRRFGAGMQFCIAGVAMFCQQGICPSAAKRWTISRDPE